MDLSYEHLDMLLQVANDASLGSTFAERMDAVSDSLMGLVPGSSMSMIVLDPSGTNSDVRAFLKNNDLNGAFEYAQHYVQDDPLPQPMIEAPGSPLRLSDNLGPAGWGHDSYTGEFLPRYHIRHLMGVAQPLPDGRVLQIAIHRGHEVSNFSQRELHLVELASHDLGRAAFGSLLRERLSRSLHTFDDDARVGIFVFNAQGFVEHADGGARAIIRRLGDGFPMESLIGDLQVARAQGCKLQRSVRIGDEVLVLRCRPLERGEKASVLVVIEIRSPEERLDFEERLGSYELTPREQDIARCACKGLTNVQIAAELGISPATVSVHMSRVFRKAGVSGRIELTRLLTGPSKRKLA